MTARLKLPHLTVCLSGRCNLGCLYCYSGNASGEAPDEERLLRGLDFFLAQAPDSGKITFLGGEPLLQGRLLKRAVLRIRALNRRIPVKVFTNGTLIDRRWLSFFSRHRVSIALSLDGDKAANDAFRRVRSGKASVFSSVLRRLAPADRGAVTINMVVTPQTAGALAANILRLRALGFRSIAWAPDITAYWRKRDMALLKRSASLVKLHYFRSIKKGLPPYEIANIHEALQNALTGKKAAACSNLTLGADGDFYPCDKLLAAPAEARARFAMKFCGRRLDLSGRRIFFAEAVRNGVFPGAGPCRIGPWALLRFRPVSGRPAAPAFLAGQEAVGCLVSGWLASMAREGLKFAAFRRAHGVALTDMEKS
jgi:uncharacterized protein